MDEKNMDTLTADGNPTRSGPILKPAALDERYELGNQTGALVFGAIIEAVNDPYDIV